MPLAPLDGEPTGHVSDYRHAGPLMTVQKMCGKSCLPQPLQSIHGAISGSRKKCFFTVIISLSVKFGVRVPPNHQKLWPQLECYIFCAALFDIHVMITHIAGTNNQIADALSRFQETCFRQLAPLAEPLPHPCMANPVLVRQFHEYHSLGVAPSTRCTYQAGVRSYQQFCKPYNIPDFPSTSWVYRLRIYNHNHNHNHSHCAISAPLLLSECHTRQLKSTQQGYGQNTQRGAFMIPPMISCCNCFVLESSAHKEEPPTHIYLSQSIFYVPLRTNIGVKNILFPAGENITMWSAFMLAFYAFLRAVILQLQTFSGQTCISLLHRRLFIYNSQRLTPLDKAIS